MHEPTITGICPNCNQTTYADGVHNGVGYVYPPLYCPNCGWSEHCGLFRMENCFNECAEYEKCYSIKENPIC